MKLNQKILKAINNWKLKLIKWNKNWFNYKLSIQKLIWERNLKDWYLINIFDKNWSFLGEIFFDINLENYYLKKINNSLWPPSNKSFQG